MNSKQRRKQLRQLERLYGADLNHAIAEARLLGETSLPVSNRQSWTVDYIRSHRPETLKAIDRYARHP